MVLQPHPDPSSYTIHTNNNTTTPLKASETNLLSNININRTTMPTYRSTRRTKPSLLTRLRTRGGRKAHYETTTTTTTHKTTGVGHHGGHHNNRHHHTGGATVAPAHHHRRRPSLGDKVSGAMMKLRGSLTRRPGLKVRSLNLKDDVCEFSDRLSRLLAPVGCMGLMDEGRMFDGIKRERDAWWRFA